MSWRWAWLAVGIVLLGVQSHLRPSIQHRQEEAELVLPTTEGASADLSVPVLALGAFRGLVVDYLWLRADTLRRNERYVEARQLNRQICRLQPRVWITWSHLAHDLAYNVSREQSTPEARWRWIQGGISVLRDDGLRFNPREPRLYLRLAETFENKVGNYTDDFHLDYKRYYALDLHAVLGEATLEELAAAPELDEHPEPAVAQLVGELEDLGRDPIELLVDAAPLEGEALVEAYGAEVAKALERLRAAEAWPAAELSARAEALVARHRLDPATMLEVESKWGDLDWRTCHSASVYWAELGRRAALEQGELWYVSKLERVALLGLRNAMRRGRVVILPGNEVWLRPLPVLALALDRNYRASIQTLQTLEREYQARFDDRRAGGFEAFSELEMDLKGRIGGHISNMQTNHMDQLVESIMQLADYGLTDEAKRLYATGRATYPDWNDWREDYPTFVTRLEVLRYADSELFFESHASMSQYVEGCWIQAYRAIAFGEDAFFKTQRMRAQRAQRRWTANLKRLARDDPRAAKRLGVPFEMIRKRAAYAAAQSLSPQLRQRLAERAGLPREVLESPPAEVKLPEQGGER